MTNLLILGTDTNAGKTTFATLFLAVHGTHYAYWKPLETGESDSDNLSRHVAAEVYSPILRLSEPVAPPLAARNQGRSIPLADELARLRPLCQKHLLIETFGSPFSPLNDTQLQIEFILALGCPSLLVSSSTLGAIGRTLQCLRALESHGHRLRAVVLLGPSDDYALAQIKQHQPGISVFSVLPPKEWSADGFRKSALEQERVLQSIHEVLQSGAITESPPGDVIARDRKLIWHPYTPLRGDDAPLVCVGAQDEFLHLADGRRVIDGISSWWTILHGHRFPPLMEALAEATRNFDHVHFAGVTHVQAVELAELLLSSLPAWSAVGGGRVFFSENGSTAVEVALKMAYQFWCHHGERGRTGFVGFEHGYHGDTFGAMSVGRDPTFFGTFEPLLFRADILPLDPEILDDHLRKNPGQIAGVIIEPLVQGAGGMRTHSPKVLQTIFAVAKKHHVLFIADEVMTGGGRLGALWAHQQAGIVPDLICAAKTLAGGVLPLAATLASPHICAAWETVDRERTFFHGHSFTANPIACAVAAANWRLLTSDFPAGARRIEKFWKEALLPLASSPGIQEVRILGSIAAVEVAGEKGYLAEAGRQMRRRCLERGVLLRPLGNVIYAMPPLRTSETSLGQIADALRAAVETGHP